MAHDNNWVTHTFTYIDLGIKSKNSFVESGAYIFSSLFHASVARPK